MGFSIEGLFKSALKIAQPFLQPLHNVFSKIFDLFPFGAIFSGAQNFLRNPLNLLLQGGATLLQGLLGGVRSMPVLGNVAQWMGGTIANTPGGYGPQVANNAAQIFAKQQADIMRPSIDFRG